LSSAIIAKLFDYRPSVEMASIGKRATAPWRALRADY
jgi:hypothetical protein